MIFDKLTLHDVKKFLSSAKDFIDALIEVRNRPSELPEGGENVDNYN